MGIHDWIKCNKKKILKPRWTNLINMFELILAALYLDQIYNETPQSSHALVPVLSIITSHY